MSVQLIALVWAMLQTPVAAQDCHADSAASLAVRAVVDGIVAADNARDIEKVLSFYSADAILLPPNADPVQGRAAIRPGYEALFSGSNPAIVTRIDEICVSNGLAFVRGHNGGQMIGRGSNPSRALNDYYVMTLRLEADARWRISHLIWHPGKP